MEKEGWVRHLVIRISAIPVVFIILYVIILGGKSDSMGLAVVYAFLAFAIIGVLFLVIEAVSLYRRKMRNKFNCNLLLLALILFSLFALLGGG